MRKFRFGKVTKSIQGQLADGGVGIKLTHVNLCIFYRLLEDRLISVSFILTGSTEGKSPA